MLLNPVKMNKKGVEFPTAVDKNCLRGFIRSNKSPRSINAGKTTVYGPDALWGAGFMRSCDLPPY